MKSILIRSNYNGDQTCNDKLIYKLNLYTNYTKLLKKNQHSMFCVELKIQKNSRDTSYQEIGTIN